MPCRGFCQHFKYRMSDEARQETTNPTLTFKIPTSTPTGRSGANVSRPNLASYNTGNVNHNGQCACWDLVVPALNLLQPLEIALANTCLYHRNYFSRRINLERTHRCNCHYQPDEYRCLDCGYCHLCGCDLVTTSTEYFHRCTCHYCLARCCPHRPLYHSARQAQRRHALLRELQKSERCPPVLLVRRQTLPRGGQRSRTP